MNLLAFIRRAFALSNISLADRTLMKRIRSSLQLIVLDSELCFKKFRKLIQTAIKLYRVAFEEFSFVVVVNHDRYPHWLWRHDGCPLNLVRLFRLDRFCGGCDRTGIPIQPCFFLMWSIHALCVLKGNPHSLQDQRTLFLLVVNTTYRHIECIII